MYSTWRNKLVRHTLDFLLIEIYVLYKLYNINMNSPYHFFSIEYKNLYIYILLPFKLYLDVFYLYLPLLSFPLNFSRVKKKKISLRASI